MKREILFRGKRKDNGEWVYGDLTHGVANKRKNMYILPLAHNLAYLEGCDPLDGYNVSPETVSQFTGLTDKNEKKIFEGDIVRVCEYENDFFFEGTEFRNEFSLQDIIGKKSYEYIAPIIYEHSNFYVRDKKDTETCISCFHGDQRHSFPIFEIEVIGNIHDNPELLP